VPQRVATDALGETGFKPRSPQHLLHGRFVEVMPSSRAAWIARVEAQRRGWKQELPAPFTVGVRILAVEGVRQLHLTEALRQVSRVDASDALDLLAQSLFRPFGERHASIFVSLAFTNYEQIPLKVNVLHAQSATFHLPHAGAVKQLDHQPDLIARQLIEQPAYFVHRQDGRQSQGPLGVYRIQQGEILLQDVLIEKQDAG